MATPLTADRLTAALRAEGVRLVEHRSWRTHNRNHKGPFGPVNGLTIHHTAGVGPGIVDYCYNGTADLPGPVCHTVLTKAARPYMVGHGRANHAGTFAANAHNAVVNESSTHPRPDSAEPIDGNTHYYGLEIENRGDGRDPYPDGQYGQAVRWAAAICRAHGWTADSVIGHKEGTRRKIDPSFDMNKFRRDVAERLKHPASWSPGGTPEEDDPMAGITKADIYDAVWKTDAVTAPDTAADRATNEDWQPQSYLRDIGNRVRATQATVAAQNAAITELARTVAVLAANSAAVDPEALVARITAAIESVTVRLDVTQEA